MSQADREKWELRYRERRRGPETREPSPLLASLDDLLPRTGRALDVAGGAGRNAIWAARRGLDVLVADISETALALARAGARAAGVGLGTLAIDLEQDPLPAGPWDLVLSFNFLRRALFAEWPAVLAPGGILVYVQPTLTNLERHDRPPAGTLLEDGELGRLVQDLEIVRLQEGWLDDGRHEARLVARKGRA